MPFTKILIHVVWSTKNRERIITKALRTELIKHINENARSKQIFIDVINCTEDHIHLLISLSRDQTISKVVQLIKGESSFWVNKNKLTNGKFEWEDEYFAVSVSESVAERVREYIRNQEEHHRVKSFSEEYEVFLKKYGFRE